MKQITIASTVMVLVLSNVRPSKAQLMGRPATNEIPRQSVYVEFGGNAVIYSMNYDVVFHNDWGFRLGGAFYPAAANDGVFYTSTVGSTAFFGLIMGQRLFGNAPNQLETGAGILFGTIYDPQKWDSIEPPGITFTLGYRYYPADPSKFTFKAAFTPIINKSGFHPYFGISLGVTLTPEGDADLN
ncbi:MAG: hypothetical protein PVH63_05875 [Balneolaceae bacterium]|jgi:hypothetical protein